MHTHHHATSGDPGRMLHCHENPGGEECVTMMSLTFPENSEFGHYSCNSTPEVWTTASWKKTHRRNWEKHYHETADARMMLLFSLDTHHADFTSRVRRKPHHRNDSFCWQSPLDVFWWTRDPNNVFNYLTWPEPAVQMTYMTCTSNPGAPMRFNFGPVVPILYGSSLPIPQSAQLCEWRQSLWSDAGYNYSTPPGQLATDVRSESLSRCQIRERIQGKAKQ